MIRLMVKRESKRKINKKLQELKNLSTHLKEEYKLLRGRYRSLLLENDIERYIKHQKADLANYVYVQVVDNALGNHIHGIIAMAWFCEKLKLNVQFIDCHFAPQSQQIFTYEEMITKIKHKDQLRRGIDYFEKSILGYSKTCQEEKFAQLKKPFINITYDWFHQFRGYYVMWEDFAKNEIPGEYGYKIIQKLGIKKDLQQQAERWFCENVKRRCVGVHYRCTDGIHLKRVIKIESYISYLQKVLDEDCDIFVCSDQAQFIDKMHEAFPGRTITRNIERSYDLRSLHKDKEYSGPQQRQNALMDVLILAKTEMIYTPGSYFIDTVRFFNPSTKVVSLDGRRAKDPNYLPIPYPELVEEMHQDTAWKEAF